MTRTRWSPRFAWGRRPGGKFDGYGRDYFLPDENGQTGEEEYLSATPRREQIARWLREERSAMLRATPLDALTDQIAWRIAARMGGSADDWPVRPELLGEMRETYHMYYEYGEVISLEEMRAEAEGRDPDPRAWAQEQAYAEAGDAALDALMRARHLPDDIPEEHRRTVAEIAFNTADELRRSVAARHGDPSDAQLARHANVLGILHDPNNRLQRRRDARTLRWALEDYLATTKE